MQSCNKNLSHFCFRKFSYLIFVFYLNSLISIAHHSNQQVNENDNSDQQINGKEDLEHLQSPVSDMTGHLQILRSGQTEKGEEQTFEGVKWGHRGFYNEVLLVFFGRGCVTDN